MMVVINKSKIGELNMRKFLVVLVCSLKVSAVELTYGELGQAMSGFNMNRFQGFDQFANIQGATSEVIDLLNGYAASSREKNRPRIERTTSVMPHNGGGIDDNVLNQFVNYQYNYTRCMHTLDFSGCGDNLTFLRLQTLCANPFFYGLQKIIIPHHLLDQAEEIIELVLDSRVGSVRGLPQISVQHDIPITVVELTFIGNQPNDDQGNQFNCRREKFDFTINYERPDGQPSSYRSSRRSLKVVKIDFEAPEIG
jgi:hypothetical protein